MHPRSWTRRRAWTIIGHRDSEQGIECAFPTDPKAGTQAAPFAALLDGSEWVVVQRARPREHDARVFKYVGVAGVDRPRIVQVGISGPDLGER